ncbi:MAG: starch-binding protein [Myxococcales bacterium]
MSKLSLYFKRPKGWASSIRIHYWGTKPSSSSTTWPGVPMVDIGGDWYSCELKGVTSASIVFNDGAGQQTADLSRDQDGWYLLPTGWSAKNPEAAATPEATTTKSRGGFYTSA